MKKIITLIVIIATISINTNQSFSINKQTAAATGTEVRTMKVGKFDVSYSMKNRTITNTPKVEIMTEEHGTVVVDVTIDKYGHVLNAVPGAKGTTTKSNYLMIKAKQCAESALYDTYPQAPIKLQGTFTITF